MDTRHSSISRRSSSLNPYQDQCRPITGPNYMHWSGYWKGHLSRCPYMYIVIHCGCWRGQRQLGNWGREDLGMGPEKSSSMRIFGIGYIVKFWGKLRTQSLNTYTGIPGIQITTKRTNWQKREPKRGNGGGLLSHPAARCCSCHNREKDFGDTTTTTVCTLYTNPTDPPDPPEPPDPTDACPETANIATACPTGFWGKG